MEKGHDVNQIADFAKRVIQESGQTALRYYGRGNPRLKFDEQLATEAEIEVSNFFKERLRTLYPQHKVFQNTLEMQDYTHAEERYLWIFDPLDGVANFLSGIPIWALSLALLENFWPVFGVVFMPATGDLFHAQAGGAAFRGSEEIRISPQEDINDESLLLTYSRFHQHYQSSFPGKVRNLGCTAAHICYVAMGSAEAAVIANEGYQGLAAGRIIVEAAGGKILKMNGENFYLNEYLDGRGIDEHLLVGAEDICERVRICLGARNA